jgi:nitroreductase
MSLFRARRSTRNYRQDPVEQEKLEKIIQAGRVAPTGGNQQPLNYVVIHTEKFQQIRKMAVDALADQAKRIEQAIERHQKSGEPLSQNDLLRQGYVNRWREMPNELEQGIDRLFYHAPVLMICHVNPKQPPTPDVDACLAGMQMVLMAEALGLGTCFCGFLVFAIEESAELRGALKIPKDHIAPISFMVGYPDVKFLRLVAREPARISWI